MKYTWAIIVSIAFILVFLSMITNTNTEIAGILGLSEEIIIKAPIPDAEEYPYYKVIYEEHEIWSKPELMKPKESLPSDEDALKIADQYVQDHGGFPEGAYLNSVESLSVWSVNKMTNEVIKKDPIIVEVTYNRLLNEIPVVGPGDTICVSIGEDGEILYFFRTWRLLEERGYKEMIPAQKAIELLRNGEVIEKSIGNSGHIDINKIEVGYFSENSGNEQEFYEPVWIFRGVDSQGNNVTRVVKGVLE